MLVFATFIGAFEDILASVCVSSVGTHTRTQHIHKFTQNIQRLHYMHIPTNRHRQTLLLQRNVLTATRSQFCAPKPYGKGAENRRLIHAALVYDMK